jgi:MOSC domain-containing protein YiiM
MRDQGLGIGVEKRKSSEDPRAPFNANPQSPIPNPYTVRSRMFQIVSINVSQHKGEKKTPVPTAELRENVGIAGDAHADGGDRSVSLLAMESIERMQSAGHGVSPGAFAENITTRGIDLMRLPIGTRLALGSTAVVEITRIGKTCHSRCAIYEQAGDCVMPREGVFARVIRSGTLSVGDIGEISS